MPFGGDVTQFFLGLMAFYRESLQEGRLPVWNDLWGYGFPGLAESQMGVFYPVHVFLYRWLNTETAYVVSLVFHTHLGRAGRLLGGAADEDLADGIGSGRVFLDDIGFLLDPSGPPLGLHDGMLDALGVGARRGA